MEARPTLTLGPVLFNWPADQWRDFYARIADEAPLERVCIGEIVCSKRLPFIAETMSEAIERLQRGGKSVILSSLILPTLARERALIGDLLAIPDVLIEANDVSALPRVQGRPHVIGPFVNVYNEETVSFLTKGGAVWICLPPELPLSSIAALAAAAPDTALEVWSFGRIPLAISARCYHARIHGLAKDSCQFVCGQDPDGLVVETLDHERFLAVNGVQTLSHACCNLLGDLARLQDAGIRSFRLSPHHVDMVKVANLFRDVLDERRDADSASHDLRALASFAPFANGFLSGSAGYEFAPAN